MICEPLGDSALLVRLSESPSLETVQHAAALAEHLRSDLLPGVRDISAAYGKLLVVYDALELGDEAESALNRLHEWVARAADLPGRPVRRTFEIPVVYGGEAGPDLPLVAEHARLSIAEVIAQHSGADYFVGALGFLPGFAYLCGLPKNLQTPRRSTPRTRVAPGSVGIGGPQTGVYPVVSPGGWNLIGRTSVSLFDPAANPPALLQVGDRVRFVPAEGTSCT